MSCQVGDTERDREPSQSILLPSEGAGATPALPRCHSQSGSGPQPGSPRGWDPGLVSQLPAPGWGTAVPGSAADPSSHLPSAKLRGCRANSQSSFGVLPG